MIWDPGLLFIFLSSRLSRDSTPVNGGSGIGATDNNTVLMLATTLTDGAGNPGEPPMHQSRSGADDGESVNLNVEIDDAAAGQQRRRRNAPPMGRLCWAI